MHKEPSKEIDMLVASVIDAALEVHRALGPGFLESVYEEALCVELSLRDIGFERQKPLSVSCKNQSVGEARIDLLIEKNLIVELKAAENLAPIHTAQVISYFKGCRSSFGLADKLQCPFTQKRHKTYHFIL